MSKPDRSEIRAGLQMEDGGYPAEQVDSRCKGIAKGVYLVSEHAPTATHFFMSALDRDRLAIAEISRRLQHVKNELDNTTGRSEDDIRQRDAAQTGSGAADAHASPHAQHLHAYLA